MTEDLQTTTTNDFPTAYTQSTPVECERPLPRQTTRIQKRPTPFKPTAVLLSETHWLDNKQVKFKRYKVVLLNRQTGQGGGVAILVRKTITSSCLPLPQLEHIEAVGIKIKLNNKYLDLVSVYCPHGNCSDDEISRLFSAMGETALVDGDFNGHSPSGNRDASIRTELELRLKSCWQMKTGSS